jgi:sugar lactone lactonase YvrE
LGSRTARLSCAIIGVVALATFACACATNKPAVAMVTTLAGKPRQQGFALGRGAGARFSSPGGLACNAAGDVFVADTDSATVCKITPDGVVSVFAGGYRGSADGRGTAARFEAPNGMAIDPASNLFVADEAANTIRKITPAGVVTTVAGKAGATGSSDGRGAAARFSGPVGIACDADGDLYVVDSGNDTIRKIAPDGMVTTVAGKAGVTGTANGRGVAARFDGPAGIARDASGDLYVTDLMNDTIRKIAPDGMVSTFAGKPRVAGYADGRGPAARFYQPSGIACSASGDLYVADCNYNTIRKITPDGLVTTVAGDANVRGSADGPGPVARFNVPGSLALGADGTLYVSDAGNYTVRKITWGS